MAVSDIILIMSGGVGLIAFIAGFLLVYKNLKNINLIERDSFSLKDLGICMVFALVFASVWVVVINLFYGIIDEEELAGTSFIGITLTFLLFLLLFFPMYNSYILSKPTSDATTNFDKKLEDKFLDKYKGTMSYAATFTSFIVLYIVPVFVGYFVLDMFLTVTILEILYLWFLFVPLIFLNTFSASGQVASIISSTYSHQHHLDPREERYLTDKKQVTSMKGGINRIKHTFFILLAWIPYITGYYTVYSAISKLRSGDSVGDGATGFSWISFATLCVQVIFAVKGFFSKYWKKKSKTKTIDFIFSVWIFVAISINLLINFAISSPHLLEILLGGNAILDPLKELLLESKITNSLNAIQGFIMIFYGGFLLFNKNSDFHADLKLSAVNNSFGLKRIEEIRKAKKTKSIETVEVKDLDILVKSALLPPVFNKQGLDLNENIRKKASQYLYLAAYEDRKRAEKIVDTVAMNTIEHSDEAMEQLSFLARFFDNIDKLLIKLKLKMNVQRIFFSDEAIELLGQIGQKFPELVSERLINAINSADPQLQQQIFNAIGDMGENKRNLPKILSQIRPFFESDIYDIRKRANMAISEMIVEGDYNDKQFVNTALNFLNNILNSNNDSAGIIETTLESVLNLTVKVPKEIEMEEIYPYLDYAEKNKDKHKDKSKLDFITQYSIAIVSYCVYYNLESFPFQKIYNLLESDKSYIRYVAADALGNYILLKPEGISETQLQTLREKVISKLMVISIEDKDEDVREMASESISEYLVMNRDVSFQRIMFQGNPTDIIDYYIEKLGSENIQIQSNSSEALKAIGPTIQKDIYRIISRFIEKNNLEVKRDLLETLGLLGNEIHKKIDLNQIYEYTAHEDNTIREKSIFALGMMAETRADEIDIQYLIDRLEDAIPNIRLQTIFALGNIGAHRKNVHEIIQVLIDKLFKMDRSSNKNLSEVELYAESLGKIGAEHPSNEIVISLQQALMGDTNVYAKDVIAKAIYQIGEGMIRRGNTRRIINDQKFYERISWLKVSDKEQLTIGNLIIILIEAIQLKNVPSVVMNEISDSLQDLLPAFLFAEQEKEDELLETIKGLLSQAYYSNYNQEILETIDRIDSLLSFKQFFKDKREQYQYYSIFFAKSYSPDGKQFYDQGKLFMLQKEDPRFVEYALKSFEIAVDLAPNEYFTSDCNYQLGLIYLYRREYNKAEMYLNDALEMFASLDFIIQMKKTQEKLKRLEELRSDT